MSECTDGEAHRNRQTARLKLEMMILEYADNNDLTDLDLVTILTGLAIVSLRRVDRADEERRTGFRHRLAGE